jgi:Tfp pilus assembly protein PilE
MDKRRIIMDDMDGVFSVIKLIILLAVVIVPAIAGYVKANREKEAAAELPMPDEADAEEFTFEADADAGNAEAVDDEWERTLAERKRREAEREIKERNAKAAAKLAALKKSYRAPALPGEISGISSGAIGEEGKPSPFSLPAAPVYVAASARQARDGFVWAAILGPPVSMRRYGPFPRKPASFHHERCRLEHFPRPPVNDLHAPVSRRLLHRG